jgi:glycosyltransferase involved in cell wall biosynthesis
MRLGIDAVPFAYEQTGIGRYLGSVLGEMQNLDASVEFLLYSPLPVVVPMRGGNWRMRTASRGPTQRPSVWMQTVLPSLLAADKVDAFWAQPTNLPISLRRWCLRVLTIHDLVPYVRPESMRFRSWLRMRLMLGPVARAADALVVDSRATAALACRHLGIRKERVSIVYAAAQSEFRQVPKDEARDTVAKRFGLPDDYILCVSTIEPRKDHLTLFRAIDTVRTAPLLVLVGGEGWRSRHILRRIREREASGRVRYLGRVDDRLLPALYSAAKLSVYPSLYEGFGLPVLESMACGCPVLSSDSSSLPEVGGAAARHFRTGDAVSLSARLKELLDSQPDLDAMSDAGLVRAGLFSFRRAAEQLLQIIREGVARQHR